MANHFTDINYLTGRRMQRNKNNDIGKDRAPHLKQSLKRFKKDNPPRDDVNFYSKVLNKRALNPIKPSTSNKRRVTVEPDLDIFGNDRRQRFERCGIFRNSIGRQIHLEPKSKLPFPKKNNNKNSIVEHCEAFAQTESPVAAQASLFENVFKDNEINQQPPLTTFIEKVDETPNFNRKNKDTTFNSSGTNKDRHGSFDTNEPPDLQLFDPAPESFTDFFQSFEQSQPIDPLTISSPILTDQQNVNYYENDLSLRLPSPIPTHHPLEDTFENPQYTEIHTPKISNSSFIPPNSVEAFLDSPILPSEISKQFTGSSFSAPLDHPIHIDPLTENVQKLYQLISHRSYENVKNIVQSSPYLFQFDNSMWDF